MNDRPDPSDAGQSHRVGGRAWLFGDSIDTDAMYPGFAMKLEPAEAARHVFYDLRPGWADQVRPGDVLVAGRNFGVGSSRPVAPLLRRLGIVALVADEINSLFLRNAINYGLPAMTVPGISAAVTEGDTVTLDLHRGRVETPQRHFDLAPLPPMVLDILDAGGLMPRLIADGLMPADGAA